MKSKEQIIKDTTAYLKELGLYKPHKDVGIEIYAQSVIDWRRAVKDAEDHGEINESKNGMTQVNAYHTQKNHYSTVIKQWEEKLFKVEKEIPKREKKSEDKRGVNSLFK